MKALRLFSAALGPVLFAMLSPAAHAANPADFAIERGVNLSHWLSQDFGWSPRETFITEHDIAFIASIGYDHVRLPIDEKELWDENGSPNEPAFTLINDAIGWCAQNDLRVILDLHTVRAHHFNAVNEGLTNTLWTDPEAQAGFLKLWADIIDRVGHHPVNLLAYEIMNEPVADDHEDWNKLVASSLKRIRASEPDRVVVIGSNRWQIPQTLPFLNIPENDRNIILSTHSYSPLIFTHYTAEWTPLKVYEGEVQYPGRPISSESLEQLLQKEAANITELVGNAADVWNRDRIEQELQPAIQRAKELGLQLYCGEFGCLPTVPREDRLQYYRDFVQVMEDNDMAWANWEYKGDFGIFEWHPETLSAGAPDIGLIEALLGSDVFDD